MNAIGDEVAVAFAHDQTVQIAHHSHCEPSALLFRVGEVGGQLQGLGKLQCRSASAADIASTIPAISGLTVTQ